MTTFERIVVRLLLILIDHYLGQSGSIHPRHQEYIQHAKEWVNF